MCGHEVFAVRFWTLLAALLGLELLQAAGTLAQDRPKIEIVPQIPGRVVRRDLIGQKTRRFTGFG